MSEKKYPAWRFHKELLPEGKIVHSAKEDDQLGPGWEDTYPPTGVHPASPTQEPVDQLVADVVAMPTIVADESTNQETPQEPVEQAKSYFKKRR